MYDDGFLNYALLSLENSKIEMCEYKKALAIATFKLIVDEFAIEAFMETHFTKEHYETYFKKIVKKYNKPLHKQIKQELREMEIENEIRKFFTAK